MFSFQFIWKRLVHLILVFLGVSIVTFSISHVIPGDPARMLVGPHATQETLEATRIQLGLDQPVLVQYEKYMTDLAHGNLGTSIRTQRPVSSELARSFPATLELTLAAMLMAIVFGVILGVAAAVHRDRWIDHASRIISLVGVSTPLFWSGIIALIVFYKMIPIFPASGRLDTFLSPPPDITGMYIIDGLLAGDMDIVLSAIHHLLLPAFCLAYVQMAIVARQVRSSMIDVLEQDYIRTAKSCGIPRHMLIYRYALKNALLPTVTVTGLTIGELLGGAIITETIFAWPGMGKYVMDSISFLDFPAIMGFTLVVSFSYVLINMAVDILYSFLNPQIREVDES
jgi:peptide/nickel transport system permease protein